MAIAWAHEEERVRALAPQRLHGWQQANAGSIADAMAGESFCHNVAKTMGARHQTAATYRVCARL